MPVLAKSKGAQPATRKTGTTVSKRAARPRKRSVRKQVSDPENVKTDRSVGNEQDSPARGKSARQAEQLAILALALLFGVIGLALHFFWFPSILLMALLFGLSASELRSRRGGGVISEVVTTVVAEAKGVAEDITNTEANQRDESNLKDPPLVVTEPTR